MTSEQAAPKTCDVREHAGLENVIHKMGMAQPLMPDPELGQDVAFLAHVITKLQADLDLKSRALKEAEDENSKFMKRIVRYKEALEKVSEARRSGCSTGEAMSKSEFWAREALSTNPEGETTTLVTREQAKTCLTLGGRKTTDVEIDRFLEEVKSGIPVMPVTFFCNFLKKWGELCGTPYPTENFEGENQKRRETYDAARLLFIDIQKSNLLWRLIYAGEPVREEPCLVHKGRWSGCMSAEDTGCKGACMFEGNVTGWLPKEQKA